MVNSQFLITFDKRQAGRKALIRDHIKPSTNPSSHLLVLVVEDDPTTLTLLSRLLERESWDVTTARNLAEAAAAMSAVVPDVAVVDVYLGEEDGLTFVHQLRERDQEMGIMVISAEDTDSLARKAIESGADNFLSKPIAAPALTLTVRKLGELRHQRRRAFELESQLKKSLLDTLFPEIVTHSDAMRAVLRLVEKVAPRDLTVLICGESGTGKDLVARAIHQLSPRGSKSFVELNCAALPASLVESELFGHEKGSFTGAVSSHAGKIEQAAGGTLFLDEIGDLP
ncbi:MAG: sigma 54-interacting transcriptional regulator, partial [bacterium]